ncbi:MAG: hypothetical protein OEM65_06990, partial [Desulfuromonadales bacterium]|nr:hypothetical protein [Desulfuromonadales bacterium]
LNSSHHSASINNPHHFLSNLKARRRLLTFISTHKQAQPIEQLQRKQQHCRIYNRTVGVGW